LERSEIARVESVAPQLEDGKRHEADRFDVDA
jgi:hypothetical protein